MQCPSKLDIYKYHIYVLLSAILLIPHGVGLDISGLKIDLPRLAIIYLICLSAMKFLLQKKHIHQFRIDTPKLLLALSAVLAFVSCFNLEMTYSSLLLWTKVWTLSVIFPVSFVYLIKDDDPKYFINCIYIISAILCFVVLYEVASAGHIVPRNLRSDVLELNGQHGLAELDSKSAWAFATYRPLSLASFSIRYFLGSLWHLLLKNRQQECA